ncbi:rhodopsin [Exaiptasia diaphana]|uniref:G-protein coupled receptors family 1 profile domain-containing protein n=1 Tax=Exaiptasia diaphana TaxID=2652724 RepID=A0A913YAA9_EXADI|nr:rhodopsin [Exaiptasia diaphana]KXJ21153.1 rhodopsin [Exaiptasia diaphana]
MPFSIVILVIGLLLGITTLIGIFGNFAVVLAVSWNKTLRTQLGLFLVNLAISDIGMSASCMPFAVATVLFHKEHIGETFCYFNGFINTLFSLASILTMCSFSVFQYVSIVLPFERMMTNFRCLLMILGVWIVSGFLATGPIMHWGRYEFTSNIFNCDYFHSNHKAEISYDITLMVAGYLLPLFVMIFSYTSIFAALHKHSSRMTRTTSSSSITSAGAAISAGTKLRVTVLLIFLTLLVCRTPFFVYLVFVVAQPSVSIDFLSQLSFWAIYLHSASNPFIFTFKHVEYQETLKEIYSTCRCAIVRHCCAVEEGLEDDTNNDRNKTPTDISKFPKQEK